MRRICIFAGALLALSSPAAFAGLRTIVYDDELVSRSELIVVGHLDPASLKCVQSPPEEDEHNCEPFWNCHATLIVSEVLRGTDEGESLPVIIYHGLTPRVGGFEIHPLGSRDRRREGMQYPNDLVEIYDTGSSAIRLPYEPLVPDAGQDHLWFLRRLHGRYGHELGGTTLGIADPEALQPIWLRPYFEAFIKGDLEARLAALLSQEDVRVCKRTLEWIGGERRVGDVALVRPLVDARDPELAALAARVLAAIGDASALPLFRDLLGHPVPEVVDAALGFLSGFGDTQSMDALCRAAATAETDPHRGGGVLLLGALGDLRAVPLLLQALDWEPDPAHSSVSACAARALYDLTGIDFPLDTARATAIWERAAVLPPEVLLRRTMQADIRLLTGGRGDHWSRLARLRGLANQDPAYAETMAHPVDLGQVQGKWAQWFSANATRSRMDWVCDGFAELGLELPRPMDKAGIELLVDLTNWPEVAKERGWPAGGRYSMGDPHMAAADRLLQHYSGTTQGHPVDWFGGPRQLRSGRSVSGRRWRQWCAEHLAGLRLPPDPSEAPVTWAQLRAAPDFMPEPPDLKLTIALPRRSLVRNEEAPVAYTLTSGGQQPMTISRRPWMVHIECIDDGGRCGFPGFATDTPEGFVTLAPGEGFTFEGQHSTLTHQIGHGECRIRAEYAVMGKALGLHAWRGMLVSNAVLYTVIPGK